MNGKRGVYGFEPQKGPTYAELLVLIALFFVETRFAIDFFRAIPDFDVQSIVGAERRAYCLVKLLLCAGGLLCTVDFVVLIITVSVRNAQSMLICENALSGVSAIPRKAKVELHYSEIEAITVKRKRIIIVSTKGVYTFLHFPNPEHIAAALTAAKREALKE